MPIKSPAQGRLMRAVAHSPEFAKKVGIPQSVGQKFMTHKAEGGTMKPAKKSADKAHGKAEVAFMKAKGAPKAMIAKEKAEYGLSKGGKPKKMAYGGKAC